MWSRPSWRATRAPPIDARRLDIRIGPLKSGAAADGLVELFRDIPSLGTIEALDQGQLSADGLRRFKVTTRSPDSELVELFSFHVSREQVRIADLGAAAGTPQAGAAAAGQAVPAQPLASEGDGYGFFVDPATLAAQSAGRDATGQAAPAESDPARRSDARGRSDKPAAGAL